MLKSVGEKRGGIYGIYMWNNKCIYKINKRYYEERQREIKRENLAF